MRKRAIAIMGLLTALLMAATAPMITAADPVSSAARPSLSAAPAIWPTDHGDNHRTGFYPSGTLVTHLRPAWGRALDGAVYGSPIAFGGFVVVATENNTVYKLNASTGAIRWSRHLRAPAPVSSLACPGNISPSGITGTPAYDPATNRIFVVTNSVNPQFGAHHEVFALNATSGATIFDRRVAVPGQRENAEQQRGALTVSLGNVFIPFGGLAGDCGQYKGAVGSLKANGQTGGTFWVVPTRRMGGIWAPGGPVALNDGSIYVAIGNGASTSGAYDGGDSVTRISWNSKRMDFFAPTTWAADNRVDADLGSMTPALTSNGFILQAGKSGLGYVARASHLGGIGGQVSKGPLCRAFGVSAVTSRTVYMPCTDGLSRVDVSNTGHFTRVWHIPGVTSSPVAANGALLTISGHNLVAINSAGTQLGSVPIGTTTRFATPALAGNKAFVGTTSGIVAVNVG